VARIFPDLVSTERLLPEWDELWQRCPQATTFQRPEWLLSWWQVFQPSTPLLVEFRQNNVLVGVAPLLIYKRGSERVLAFMGGGVSDYLDVLFDPAYAEGVVARFWDLLSTIKGWDTLELTDLPPTSCLLLKNPSHWEYARTLHDVCPVLPLPSNPAELNRVLPYRLRKNLRNACNRLRGLGEARIEIAAENNLHESLSSIFRLHTNRWAGAGEPGVLTERRVQEFHRNVSPKLLRKRVLRLYTLRLNGRTIAVLHAFFERNVAYYYLQGFDMEFAWFSPGTQIFGAVAEDAVRHGMRALNFLRGRERYKYLWGTQDSPTYRIRAPNPLRLSQQQAA
jgi:CelD/BcsL family acetyltransferase involved in cellulose biosynthesis